MEQLKNITEFVVVSNLENRALNAGINKAQNWWKNRNNDNEPNKNNNNNNNKNDNNNTPKQSHQVASAPIGTTPGQLLITILCAQDLHESRLSVIKGTASSSERPYVVIECNQQRFQTIQADSNTTNRNPQWSSNNGPFGFNIFDANADRLTVWIQQNDSLRVMKRNEPKLLGMGEIHVNQLIGRGQVWLPLRKDYKPVGQLLLQIDFYPNGEPPPPYRA